MASIKRGTKVWGIIQTPWATFGHEAGPSGATRTFNWGILGERMLALRRAQDFIQATEICAGDDFVRPDNWKRGGKDKSPPADKRPRRMTGELGIFTLCSIKGNLILRCAKPIDTPVKFRNKNKYCEHHEDQGHTTPECRGGGDHNRQNPEGKKDNGVDCNTEIIATIIGVIDAKELSAGYRKAQI
ncbi:hypothetical protein Cgig2_002752 [Carnegiea gigantea]|uniref:Uncharacterized protein n=1 Tax=Carnegiea gigantea TaxID=171969 RepID=A0A9Q1GZF8_9CARY|nr:hypothetical protein Cgig2_002752 [Carnegiea gigantea]